jgi:hypothetical protein
MSRASWASKVDTPLLGRSGYRTANT